MKNFDISVKMYFIIMFSIMFFDYVLFYFIFYTVL